MCPGASRRLLCFNLRVGVESSPGGFLLFLKGQADLTMTVVSSQNAVWLLSPAVLDGDLGGLPGSMWVLIGRMQ